MGKPLLKPFHFTYTYHWYSRDNLGYEANGMPCGAACTSGRVLSIDEMFLNDLKKGSERFAELMEKESMLRPESHIKRLSFSVYRHWYSLRPCYTLTFEACWRGFTAKVNGRSYGNACEQETLTLSYVLDTFLNGDHQFNMHFLRRTMVEQGKIDLEGTVRSIVVHAE